MRNRKLFYMQIIIQYTTINIIHRSNIPYLGRMSANQKLFISSTKMLNRKYIGWALDQLIKNKWNRFCKQQQKNSNKKEWIKNESNYETREMVKKGITNIVHTKSLKKFSFLDSVMPGLLKCSKIFWIKTSEHQFCSC